MKEDRRTIYNSKYIIISFINTYGHPDRDIFIRQDYIETIVVYPRAEGKDKNIRQITINLKNSKVHGYVTSDELDRIYDILQKETHFNSWR